MPRVLKSKATRRARPAKLPTKLSDCIELAVADLEAVERQKKRYLIQMESTWHEPQENGEVWDPKKGHYVAAPADQCVVCFAGAVMAMSLDTEPTADVSPNCFTEHNKMRLLALDDIREGNINAALSKIEKELPNGLAYTPDVEPYSSNPKRFKRDVRSVAGVLRALGL